MTTQMPACLCPTCESKLDAATAFDDSGATASPGDVTICVYCNEILEFTEEFMLAKVDITTLPAELQDQLATIIVGTQRMRPTLH
jgi:hypothetical protein